MRWYLFKNETVYGPYVEEQLSAFLKSEDLVAREGTATWIKAVEDPDLADALSGIIQPAMEWHIAPLHRARMGPLTRIAVENMIKRGELGPQDMIRHQSWQKDVPLGQTKLYHFLTTPYVKIEDIPPEDLIVAPRQVMAPGSPSPVSFRDKIVATFPKVRFDFAVTPRVKAMIVAAVLLPPFICSVHDYVRSAPKISSAQREGWSIPRLVAGGRDVKMVIGLPPQPGEITVVAVNEATQEFSLFVKLDARTPQVTSKEINLRFEEMAKNDSIRRVRVLYKNDIIAERKFSAISVEKLERKKPQ